MRFFIIFQTSSQTLHKLHTKIECSWDIYKWLLLKSLRFNGLWWNKSDLKRVLVITMFHVIILIICDEMLYCCLQGYEEVHYIYNINYVLITSTLWFLKFSNYIRCCCLQAFTFMKILHLATLNTQIWIEFYHHHHHVQVTNSQKLQVLRVVAKLTPWVQKQTPRS